MDGKFATVLAHRAVSVARPPTRPARRRSAAHATSGQPARPPAALQTTTDDSQQYNTGPLGGPVTKLTSHDYWRSTEQLTTRVDASPQSSTPATMSKQHCRMLQCRMLLRQCCRFWQQCRSNVRLYCQKRQQCRTSFALKFRPFDKVVNKLNMLNLFRLCRKDEIVQ